jgi:catechol 2,3-dioxygenase-like lactoylglutathione lyase family enzyme
VDHAHLALDDVAIEQLSGARTRVEETGVVGDAITRMSLWPSSYCLGLYVWVMFRDPQINLYVADVEVSLRFYRDLFGFTETFRTPRDGPPIHVELRLGGFILGVASIEALRSIHSVDVQNAGDGVPHGEVVVWTDDVDRAFTLVTAKGARALSAPHDFLADLRAAWVADPDGNRVQMVMRRGK